MRLYHRTLRVRADAILREGFKDKAAAPTLARNGPGVNTWNQPMVGTMYGDVWLTGDVPDDVMVSAWREGEDVESGAEHWWLPFDVATKYLNEIGEP
jgi:hypothetical protein